MSKQEIARRKRMLREGRRWEQNWIRRGRPGAGLHAMQFQESVTQTGMLRRSRPFGTRGIEAAAIFMESYRRHTRRD